MGLYLTILILFYYFKFQSCLFPESLGFPFFIYTRTNRKLSVFQNYEFIHNVIQTK